MAEHRVRKDNIIYIIPTDELFIKWKNDEAFIDEYGRLMNRKPHRVWLLAFSMSFYLQRNTQRIKDFAIMHWCLHQTRQSWNLFEKL